MAARIISPEQVNHNVAQDIQTAERAPYNTPVANILRGVSSGYKGVLNFTDKLEKASNNTLGRFSGAAYYAQTINTFANTFKDVNTENLVDVLHNPEMSTRQRLKSATKQVAANASYSTLVTGGIYVAKGAVIAGVLGLAASAGAPVLATAAAFKAVEHTAKVSMSWDKVHHAKSGIGEGIGQRVKNLLELREQRKKERLASQYPQMQLRSQHAVKQHDQRHGHDHQKHDEHHHGHGAHHGPILNPLQQEYNAVVNGIQFVKKFATDPGKNFKKIKDDIVQGVSDFIKNPLSLFQDNKKEMTHAAKAPSMAGPDQDVLPNHNKPENRDELMSVVENRLQEIERRSTRMPNDVEPSDRQKFMNIVENRLEEIKNNSMTVGMDHRQPLVNMTPAKPKVAVLSF